jgi:hypothetical protein
MPDVMVRWGETWRAHHPGWGSILWTAEMLGGIAPGIARVARDLSQLSDLYRYQILREHGGVYVDTDYECRRNIECLLQGWGAAVVRLRGEPGHYENCFLAAKPEHPLFESLALGAFARLRSHRINHVAIGPPYVSECLHGSTYGDLRVLEPEVMCPYRPDDMLDGMSLPAERFPDAYAVHHWSSVWWQPSSKAYRRGVSL